MGKLIQIKGGLEEAMPTYEKHLEDAKEKRAMQQGGINLINKMIEMYKR